MRIVSVCPRWREMLGCLRCNIAYAMQWRVATGDVQRKVVAMSTGEKIT